VSVTGDGWALVPVVEENWVGIMKNATAATQSTRTNMAQPRPAISMKLLLFMDLLPKME
jgi:hypothetical protein